MTPRGADAEVFGIITVMEDSPRNRVSRWTQKLLDLSLRNRLLNARDSKQILPLAVQEAKRRR